MIVFHFHFLRKLKNTYWNSKLLRLFIVVFSYDKYAIHDVCHTTRVIQIIYMQLVEFVFQESSLSSLFKKAKVKERLRNDDRSLIQFPSKKSPFR